MKRLTAILLALAMLLSFAACASNKDAKQDSAASTEQTTETPAATETDASAEQGAEETATEQKKLDIQPGDIIGVSLNSRGSERWVRDSETLEKAITDAGYTPLIQYNENNTSTQVSQIQNMVLAGAKVIIVCPYDNGSLSAVLKEAREAGVIIINYDLAVVGTGDVDYFVGYNNRDVGVMQANAIIEGLGLDKGAEGPFYMEMFAGSLNDANCYYYFDYAMEVLKPYFDEGKLICKSGETEIEKCTIIDCLATGKPVEGLTKYKVSDDYDFELDAYFVEMFAVTKDNLQELVIDRGFYSADQIDASLTDADYGLK